MLNGKFNRLSTIWRNIAICSGTSNVQIIFDNVKQFLPDVIIINFNQCDARFKEVYLKNEIYPFLNCIAPENCYFGSFVDDELEIGFWELTDDDDEGE